MTGARQLPWLSPVPVSKQMIGLPPSVQACLFDLDGVLTDSAQLHAAAWAQVLDELLLRLTASAGWHFIPFDRNGDYRTYIDGRSRLEGVHGFLESRGSVCPRAESTIPRMPILLTGWRSARVRLSSAACCNAA